MQQGGNFKPSALRLLHTIAVHGGLDQGVFEKYCGICELDNATIIEIREAIYDGRGRVRDVVRIPQRSMSIGMRNGGHLD